MRSIGKTVLLLFLMTLSLGVLGGCAGDQTNEGTQQDKVLRIGQAPYDYEVPFIEITKQIAAEQGYKVEIVEGDVGFMFLSLVQGDIDAWSGIWLPSIHGSYHDKYSDRYELGSAIFEDAPVGWVVPKYVDADSVEDLVGNEEIVGGKLTGFEPGSGMMLVSEDMIKGYGLDLELVSGTLSSMLAEVDYAVKHEEPILFLGWRPHTMMRKYDVKILKDPKGYFVYDGDYWGMREGFEEKAPDMYNLFNNFKMSIEDVEEFLYAYQEENKDVEDLAREWVEQNRSDIDKWLEG